MTIINGAGKTKKQAVRELSAQADNRDVTEVEETSGAFGKLKKTEKIKVKKDT